MQNSIIIKDQPPSKTIDIKQERLLNDTIIRGLCLYMNMLSSCII